MRGKPVPPLQTRFPHGGPNSQSRSSNQATETQGGYMHLVEHLVAEYRNYTAAANETRATQKQPLLDPELGIKAARPLLAFFESYLRTHRPIQVFPVDDNYGLVLSNNVHLVVSPLNPTMRGTMQASGEVQVTHGGTQHGQEGVVRGDSFGVLNG